MRKIYPLFNIVPWGVDIFINFFELFPSQDPRGGNTQFLDENIEISQFSNFYFKKKTIIYNINFFLIKKTGDLHSLPQKN